MPTPMLVDGHLDIAYNVLNGGRDVVAGALATRAQEPAGGAAGLGICTVGLPELRQAGVGLVFGTLFALPAAATIMDMASRYTYHTPAEANALAREQLAVYRQLADAGHISLITSRGELAALQARREAGAPDLGLVLLIENGEPISEPAEAAWWHAQGVRIIGPAWQATRYCGGTREPGPLTPLGRELLAEMDRLGMVLDVSHMSEESFWQALERYSGPVIASHSNCRAYVSPERADRHLSDEMIRALVERDAVIGMVLFNAFLVPDYHKGYPKAQAGLDVVVRHVDRVCQIAGSARHVAIGSDMDGGLGREEIPAGLDTSADLPALAGALAAGGYSPNDIAGIMGGNWIRLLERSLP